MRTLLPFLLLVACDPATTQPSSPTEPSEGLTPPTSTTDTADTVDTGSQGTDTAPTGDTASLLPFPAGTLHEQVLSHDGEDRFYLLHVPASYDGRPMPVLFDLHGTAGPPAPEEAYGLRAAIDTAEAEGFLLVRPRSRSSTYGATTVYRWDQNPGDPDRNTDFVLALLDELSTVLAIDPDHTYVMGFSSGTSQTALLAEVPDTPFDGWGHVGGGAWWTAVQPPAGRVYLATPYRDYMRRYHHELVRQLDAAGHPEAERLHRPSMSGHELYDDMYPELWAWLERGEAPVDDGVLEPGWSVSPAPPALAAQADGDGAWLAGADLLGRFDGSSFTPSTIEGQPFLDDPMELTGLCLTDGVGAAVGNSVILWTDDGGSTFRHLDPLPEPGPPMFGYAHWTGVGCHAGEVRGVGYWSSGSSTDGTTWSDVPLAAGFGYRAQVATTAAGPDGTWVSAGYYRYLATALDADTWVAVGDHGTVLRSTDGAASWSSVEPTLPPTDELNAVAFRADGVGLAVGRAGRAWRSDDAGLTWVSVPLGRPLLLADVVWLDDGTALAVGPDGSFAYSP
jgi:predicted esterase